MERFISRERNEPPDIDIDFEHERREEVIQYIYRKYGRDRTALTAVVICYRPRSALRDMAKVLGLDPVQAERLSGAMQWWDNSVDADRLREAGFEPDNPQVKLLLDLTGQLLGFPRHLSQHVGGFVISQGLLEELVPIENAAMADRTVIEWDKDDLDELGLLKVDVLGLGMLSALRRGLALASDFRGQPAHAGRRAQGRPARLRDDLARRHHRRVPGGVARADVDAAAAQAREVLRPRSSRWPSCARGPSRAAWCIPIYAGGRVSSRPPIPARQSKKVLVAHDGRAHLPGAGHADRHRRRGLHARRGGPAPAQHGGLEAARGPRAISSNGSSRACASAAIPTKASRRPSSARSRVSASTVFLNRTPRVSRCWCTAPPGSSAIEPAAFTCALINSQPMGFYAPAQLVRDARDHGVEVRPRQCLQQRLGLHAGASRRW